MVSRERLSRVSSQRKSRQHESQSSPANNSIVPTQPNTPAVTPYTAPANRTPQRYREPGTALKQIANQSGGLTPEQQLQVLNSQISRKSVLKYKKKPAPIPAPSGNQGLTQQWRDAYNSTKTSLKTRAAEMVTPAGLAKNARAVGSAALKARDALDDNLTRYNARKKEEHEQNRKQKIDNWLALDPETRQEIIAERAQQKRNAEVLRQERSKYDEYHADRVIASATGRPFHPKVYKVPGSGYGQDDKYIDEYGRETPNIQEEYQPPQRSQRRGNSSFQDLFGGDIMGSGGDGIVGGGGGGNGRVRRSRREYREESEPRSYSQPPRKRGVDLTDPHLDLLGI